MNSLSLKSQQGYIGLAVISFLIVLSMILYPWAPPKPEEEGSCIVGEVGDLSVLSGIPAVKNMEDAPRGGQLPDLTIGGPDPNEKSDFVQIRKNVPALKNSETSVSKDWVFLGGPTQQKEEHTVNAGELPQKPGYDAYYPSEWGEIDMPGKERKYIRGEGLLMFANNDPTTISQTENGNTIYLLDVYQDKRVHDDPAKDYSDEELFICGEDTEVGSTAIISPAQQVSPKKDQLQLEWFLFKADKTWGIHCKPAVYLYPQRKQLVNVKVKPRGELSYTDPPYDKDYGWTVEANPDGKLLSALSLQSSAVRQYDYLYYESKILDSEIKKPARGWVVRFDEMESLYDQVLPGLGLNEKEAKDFSEYWLKTLPQSPYYFVGLMDKDQRDYLEPLSVTPSPDTSIRFSLYFEALDEFRVVSEPEIVTPVRNGFTLVDWGGMIKLHSGTPFTCSQ